MTPTFLLIALAVAVGAFIPTPTTGEQTARRWELDAFLAEHLPAMQDITQGLDPLTGFKEITLNLTFPSYLKLQGTITDVKFEGISYITHNYSTSTYDEFNGYGYFHIYSYFPTTVFSAKHNLEGTIHHSSGIIHPIGGGWRNLTLRSVPARSSYRLGWEIDENRHVVPYGHADIQYIEIQPNNGTNGAGWWDIDYDGLLDPISFDPALTENAIHWITQSVLEGNDYLWDDVERRMVEPFVETLTNAFANITIDEILANPPSTTRNPLNPQPGDPMRIEVIVDPPHGTMNVSCFRSGASHSDSFTTRGSIEWEWVLGNSETAWSCTAMWGEDACLNNWWEVIPGLPLCQGFAVWGSTFVGDAPRTNSTWLVDGRGRRRIMEWEEEVDDKISSWDGPIPVPRMQ